MPDDQTTPAGVTSAGVPPLSSGSTLSEVEAAARRLQREANDERSEMKWGMFCTVQKTATYLRYGFNVPAARDWPLNPARPPWKRMHA